MCMSFCCTFLQVSNIAYIGVGAVETKGNERPQVPPKNQRDKVSVDPRHVHFTLHFWFSDELKELEAKLKAGYVNRERAAQLAEKQASRMLEAVS